jgi:hypothetical protein
MKKRIPVVGALALALLSMAVLPATAGDLTDLAEPAVCTEGIGMDGFEVTPGGLVSVGPAASVMIDWSDDIVFHQFPVGQKVRTEVLLHADEGLGPAVYTLTAHLMIEQIADVDGVPLPAPKLIYSSSIAEGLWNDGPDSFYTAEVNSEGKLLYGYNWETRGLPAGYYRLTFWVEHDSTCPDVNPYSGLPITYNGVDITNGAPGDSDSSSGKIYGIVGYDFASDKSWLDMYLYSKKAGRK